MVDAANELGVSRQLFLYWIKENKIKHEVVLGVRVVTRAELERFKKNRNGTGRPKAKRKSA